MGAVIDGRLLEAETEQHLTANFNRILAMLDDVDEQILSLTARIDDVENAVRVPVLADLAVGSLQLEPEFDPAVKEYAVASEDETAQIVAESDHDTDVITITSDDATIAADGTATFAEGDNVITITVVNGFLSTVYTVTVTYAPPEE